jgi:hypothetical protein
MEKRSGREIPKATARINSGKLPSMTVKIL